MGDSKLVHQQNYSSIGRCEEYPRHIILKFPNASSRIATGNNYGRYPKGPQRVGE